MEHVTANDGQKVWNGKINAGYDSHRKDAPSTVWPDGMKRFVKNYSHRIQVPLNG